MCTPSAVVVMEEFILVKQLRVKTKHAVTWFYESCVPILPQNRLQGLGMVGFPNRSNKCSGLFKLLHWSVHSFTVLYFCLFHFISGILSSFPPPPSFPAPFAGWCYPHTPPHECRAMPKIPLPPPERQAPPPLTTPPPNAMQRQAMPGAPPSPIPPLFS